MNPRPPIADAGEAKLLRRDNIDPGTEYIAPSGAMEARLAELCQASLGIDRVGRADNFFELGGDSLQAFEFFSAVEKEFGVLLSPSTIIDHPTIAELAVLLSGNVTSFAERCLVPLQLDGDTPPLFLIHEASGNLFSYSSLVRHLGARRRIYGLIYPGQDQNPIPALTIPEIAEIYIRAIKGVQQSGPYYVAGYSFGGAVAYEIVRLLRERGDEIGFVVLIDASTRYEDARVSGLRKLARKLAWHLDLLSELAPSRWPGYCLDALREHLRLSGTRSRQEEELEAGPAVAPVSVPERFQMLISETLMRALQQYRAPQYAGQVKLLRCVGSKAPRWSKRHLGWAGRATGGVEIIEIAAGHYDVISEPTVALVASFFLEWFDQAERSASRVR